MSTGGAPRLGGRRLAWFVRHRYERIPRHQSPRTVRVVGGLLAVVWLCAGLVALVIGVFTPRWLLVVVGLAALWYGVVWVFVVRQGRQLTAREALMPWRIRWRSDA